MNREPRLDELIGTEATGTERQQLQRVHELLLQAGPPPELSPELEAGPTLQMTLQRKRGRVKPRAMMLLAAALVLVLVFVGGYAAGNGGSKSSSARLNLKLAGTSFAPQAQATLEVWHRTDGNWPMKLNVLGLKKLPPRNYYEVYLFRDGQIRGSCGTFRVTGSKRAVTVTLNSPYPLHKGDSWVVTRPGPSGAEPGQTVLQPVTA